MADADSGRPAGATRPDDELLTLAIEHFGAQCGLRPAQARRLNGSAADELRRAAKAMAVGLRIEVDEHVRSTTSAVAFRDGR